MIFICLLKDIDSSNSMDDICTNKEILLPNSLVSNDQDKSMNDSTLSARPLKQSQTFSSNAPFKETIVEKNLAGGSNSHQAILLNNSNDMNNLKNEMYSLKITFV